MQDLIIRDVRLQGGNPAGNEVLTVDANTPIDWPINWTADKSKKYSGDVYVKIFAHGFETMVAPGLATGFQTRGPSIYSQGGSGVQFCKENLCLQTLPKFSRLRGLLKGIDLMGCGAAYITPGFEGKDGDGNFLCYQLAQITQTYVRASTATQEYEPKPRINFGVWEGTVLTYGPAGNVVAVEHGRSAAAYCRML